MVAWGYPLGLETSIATSSKKHLDMHVICVMMSNLPAVHLGMASRAPLENLKKKEEKFKSLDID